MARKPTGRDGRVRTRRRPGRFGLNPRRQIVLILLVLGGLAVGYLAAMLIGGGDRQTGSIEETAVASAPVEPWYKSQPPPPAMVTDEAAPLLPEANGTPPSGGPRAYEEALPVDVYVSPHAPHVPETHGDEAAWRQYALAVPEGADGRPMVAVVIDDMGMDRKRSARIVALPGPLTLSFLTYAEDLPAQTRAARSAGHELMLHVGMEPVGRTVDPGPNVLLTGDPPQEIRRRLTWGLDRFTGFVGINNHMGSRFTEDRTGMTVVMNELKTRGLLFLDSRTTPRSVGAELARESGVPVVERNVFLDNENEVAAVRARLADVERIARKTGAAIAIGHPRDATLKALADWIPALRDKGLALVPLTAIVRAAADGTGAG